MIGKFESIERAFCYYPRLKTIKNRVFLVIPTYANIISLYSNENERIDLITFEGDNWLFTYYSQPDNLINLSHVEEISHFTAVLLKLIYD